MGFINLVNEIQFMLISKRHISNRSICSSHLLLSYDTLLHQRIFHNWEEFQLFCLAGEPDDENWKSIPCSILYKLMNTFITCRLDQIIKSSAIAWSLSVTDKTITRIWVWILIVSLYAVFINWVWFLGGSGDFERFRNFSGGDTEKFQNRSKSPDPPRNHTQKAR